MFYSIYLYGREDHEDVYEYLDHVYPQYIPREGEHVTFKNNIYQVEGVYYKLGYNTDPDINMYCVLVGPSKMEKELIREV